MLRRLQKMKAVIEERHPESRLKPLTARGIARLKKQFPHLPAHLVEFFEVIGVGSIGRSRYMIYDLLGPEGIFDEQTAADLNGVVLIGDDFAGTHEAYDTRSKWRFGSVGSSGRFQPHSEYANFIDLIHSWCRCRDMQASITKPSASGNTLTWRPLALRRANFRDHRARLIASKFTSKCGERAPRTRYRAERRAIGAIDGRTAPAANNLGPSMRRPALSHGIQKRLQVGSRVGKPVRSQTAEEQTWETAMSKDVDDRVRELETKLAFFRGAFVVASGFFLGWLGYTSLFQVPDAVRRAVDDRVGVEVVRRINEIKEKSDALQLQLAAIESRPDDLKKLVGVAAVQASIDALKGEMKTDLEARVKLGDVINLKATNQPKWLRHTNEDARVDAHKSPTFEEDRSFVVQRKNQDPL